MDTFILPSTVMDSIKPPRRWSRLPDEFPIQRMCPRVARFNAKSIMDISPTSSPLLGGAESPLSSSGSTFSFSSPPSSLLEPEAHLDPNAPSEALPRLRVHLKNHLSRVLPEVECPDDMPLETMIHRHAFAISARNEEIQSELRDSEKVDLKCFEELSSGVFGGSLFDRYMCRLLKWVKLLPETETNDDSDDDNSTSDGSGSEDDAAMGDSDASDASSQDDSDSPDFSGSSAESHSSEIIIPTTKSLPRPHVPPKHHTKSLPFLTSLREWAINHWLLTQYKLIIAHHFTSPDEIDRLFLRPARTVSPPTPTPGPLESRPTTKENAQILAHMQALTLLLKLRLLVEHERSDPERYWKMDFEHPKCQDEYAGSMLHQQNAFVGSMLNMYEDLVKRPLRFERDVQMRMMLMGGFFGFAEIEEESWFRGYDKERGELGEEVVVEVDDEVDEERERRELQFAKRLGTMVAPEWEEKKRGVSAWIDGVGSRGGGYGPSLGKAEKIALQGTTFRIEEGLNTLSRMEAEKLVTLHGGKIYLDATTPPTHILVPSQHAFLVSDDNQTTVSEYMLPEYIHTRVIDMRVAGADKESLKGLKFEFVGVLPAIDREHVISLVERHAGVVQTTYGLVKSTDYYVPGIEVDARTLKIFEKAGVRRLDEAGLLELIRTGSKRYGLRGKGRKREEGEEGVGVGVGVGFGDGGKRRKVK